MTDVISKGAAASVHVSRQNLAPCARQLDAVLDELRIPGMQVRDGRADYERAPRVEIVARFHLEAAREIRAHPGDHSTCSTDITPSSERASTR